LLLALPGDHTIALPGDHTIA